MKKTIENLTKAFIGESQARNRYNFYAKMARKEGLEFMSDVFLLTADNEKQHAKWLFRLLNGLMAKAGRSGESIKVEAEAPTVLGMTALNLQAAIDGEHYENSEMYPEFAKVAREEGLEDIADRLMAIAAAEKHHEERYSKLLAQLQGKTLFKKEKKVRWVCRKCGYVHEADSPPKACPACNHKTGNFSLLSEEY